MAAQVITPTDYIGTLMELATAAAARSRTWSTSTRRGCNLHFELPLAELIVDFYDQLKSRTQGYASLDYEYIGYPRRRPGQARHPGQRRAGRRAVADRPPGQRLPAGQALVEKLKELIPRQMFEVPVQAAIGRKVITRETIRAMRKNVLAKCYGGDITRKRKLLEKQKEGQEADEAGRLGRDPAGGLPGRAAHERGRDVVSFVDSLRLAICLGLTLFLVLLRFDAERITRSDYFRYRTPWMGPVSYYILVGAFAIGIAIILPSGREQLFLTGGQTDEMLPIMLLFVTVALLNAVALAFLRYGGILPAADRAAALAHPRRGRQRDQRGDPVPLDRPRPAPLRRRWNRPGHRHPGPALRPGPAAPVAGPRLVLPRRRGAPGLGGRRRDRRDRLGHPGDRRPLRGDDVAVRVRRRAPATAADLRPMQNVEPHHLYVHVPFCRLVCAYCDFVTVGGRADDLPRYTEGLLAELAIRPAPGELRTIYFGGGTPSLLNADQVGRIISAATDRWARRRAGGGHPRGKSEPARGSRLARPAGGGRDPHQPRGPVAARR